MDESDDQADAEPQITLLLRVNSAGVPLVITLAMLGTVMLLALKW